MQVSEEKLLYHFTSEESLFKIIENMTLKFSTFDNLNDLNEKEVNFGFTDSFFPLQIEQFIIEHCKMISFTQDYQRNCRNSSYEKGINHPRMWAQYANNHQGACIVINENKFKEINKETLSKGYKEIENVDYDSWLFYGVSEENQNPKDFIMQNFKTIFFKKHNDWQNENERRLFYIGDENFISINNCIEYICLGNKFNNYDKLMDAIVISAFKGNQFLKPHDFQKILVSSGGVSGIDNAHEIFKQITASNDKSLNYISKLRKIGYYTI